MEFEGEVGPPIGGYKTASVEQDNAIAYLSGFFVHKLNQFHIKTTDTTINTCETCSKILGPTNLNIHCYTTFKEYEKTNDLKPSLKYCSTSFLSSVKLLERTFLYYFDQHCYKVGFAKVFEKVVLDLCPLPKFCDGKITHFFVRKFVRVRLLQSIKRWNSAIATKSHADKLKKMSSCKVSTKL
jgi:hypothetical protein